MKKKLKNYPEKPIKEDKISVPDFELTLSDMNCSFWLNFKDIPTSSKDVVVAVSGHTLGLAKRMQFPPTKKYLFPLMVQLDEEEQYITIMYYCFKLNRILVFPDIYCALDGVYGNPVYPIKFSEDDSLDLEIFN